MLHGRLTPLGTQLRPVLPHLSSTRASKWSPSQAYLQCHPRGLQHATRRPSATAPAMTRSINSRDEDDGHPLPAQESDVLRTPKTRHNADFDRSYDLEPSADVKATPACLLHANAYSHQRVYKERNARASALERVFRHFVTSRKADRDPLAAEWEVQSKPTPHVLEVLQAAKYNATDLLIWAQIESEANSFVAATKLEALVRSSATPIPLFVYMSILDRLYVSAKALRVLLRLAYLLFHVQDGRQPLYGLRDDSVFIAGAGLLRHAREVWPSSLTAVVELVVNHYRKSEHDEDTLPTLTRKMNKLLKLVSMSTAETPFKDIHHQEAAMVPVLQFMAEHSPSMQINREGYRAVIRVQLGQRKSHEDQQWAELKSHAWPPWKVDRTAMDEFIDVENYGQSKAARTLARMREAGYAPEEWERNAQIYAGWDVDGTPTIQTRTNRDSRTSAWAARIETTRTAQEAWACYLAWEDRGLSHDQDVYLATVQKLREEERRSHKEEKRNRNDDGKAWPVFPGDAREIAPLPKSTHLWTYTRTKPPSMDTFYTHIRARGAVLGKHVLAFFISHAATPESGLRYLRDHISQCPDVEGILTLKPSYNLTNIAEPIYKAAITLYSRMGFVRSKQLPKLRAHYIPETDLKADGHIGIVSAIELLRRRGDPHPAWYHVILQGLTREDNFEQMSKLRADDRTAADSGGSALSRDLLRCHGAINAYQLALKVLDWQRDHHIDPDSGTFCSFCRAVENFAVAVWVAAQNGRLVGNLHSRQYNNVRLLLHDDSEKHGRRHPKIACQEEFLRLVSPVDDDNTSPSQTSDLPRLLTTPSPFALHAYVRALGWLGFYDGLMHLTHFMRQHGDELAIRKSQDRGGEWAMRRTIVALRVFLERSWLINDGSKEDVKAFEQGPDKDTATCAPLESSPSTCTPPAVSEPEPSTMSIRYEIHADRACRLLAQFRAPASEEMIAAVREVVEGVEEWGGWPDDQEVKSYCRDKKFGSSPFRK